MNRFLTKKRGKDESGGPRPSIESDSASPFRMFGKNKRSQDDDNKPTVEVNAILPSTDDFRTSLLMTGLSARFSMLREQDDPTSKLGKASDDSVLQPKRQSRLMDFGYVSSLQDISEVQSIRAPQMIRDDSGQFSDDGSSGSIMNRSRPNEGNNLFGGRQKIYKIAAGSRPGALGGRALYDDDVAKSSFQKWRQAERQRNGGEAPEIYYQEVEAPSVSLDFNSRRETNSTTSSALSASRSSAASSFTSQFSPSVKDGQIPSSFSSSSNIERNVIRTRRLYEQGLTQELQDQQSSSLSRIDTLAKTRISTSRAAADTSPSLPSPTLAAYLDRNADKRSVLSKASAPNLRSFSPPTANSSPLPPNEPLSKRNISGIERPNFGINPPLSPPISEAEDQPILPIQSNTDRGKTPATMGGLNKPQQYDDSKYAQRQRQMYQDRETLKDSQSFDSIRGPRSRSTSSAYRQSPEKTKLFVTRPDLTELDMNKPLPSPDEIEARNNLLSLASSLGDGMTLERPNDQDHPAFRKSALPTPLSLSSQGSESDSSHSERMEIAPSYLKKDEPAAAPPTTVGSGPGLSGMVRQHLRQESNASSIYDTAQDKEELSQPSFSSPVSARARNGLSTWSLTEDEYNPNSDDAAPNRPDSFEQAPITTINHNTAAARLGDEVRKDQEDFARHLAEGARRVREKLTSYADSDGEQQQPSPTLTPTHSSKDLSVPRSNPLGILRSKSSRTSLFERSRDKDAVEATPVQVPKLPSPTRQSPPPNVPDSAVAEAVSPTTDNKDNTVHAGLKAFRQARRELQRMKELETRQRHQPPTEPTEASPAAARPFPERSVSHDVDSSPYSLKQRDVSYDRAPRTSSRATSDRDRSGSDLSDGGPPNGNRPRAHSRPRPDLMDGYAGSNGYAMPLINRPRIPGMLGTTSSTPNLHTIGSAPPLPPINPRRKTGGYGGLGRQSEESSPLPSPRMLSGGESMGFPDDANAEARRQGLRRVTSDNDGGRIHMNPPPPTRRPPVPHANMSSNSMPGGMF